MAFQVVYEGPITIFYRPHSTKRSTCILHGDRSHFFESIRDGVTWAAEEGLITDPDIVINKAEARAERLDRDDM